VTGVGLSRLGPVHVSSSNPISAERYYRNRSLLRFPDAYEAFFGLHENPFSLTPDPRYLFRTRHAHDTLRQLTRGILARKGLILLTGEVGTGKTTLLNSALQLLRENPGAGNKTRSALLMHPTLTREEFIEAILTDFQISCEATRKPRRIQVLSEMLLQVRRNRGIAVLAVDEAQLLSADLLDEIRMLLEMRLGGEPLLQVILCGHPDVEIKLIRSAYSSLQPGLTVRCVTAPLCLEDTGDYIAHRMRLAGAKTESIFTVEACDAAHHHARGIPRVINILCEQALAHAGGQGLPHVTSRMIDEAAEKMPFPDGKPRGPHTRTRNSGHGSANATKRPPTAPSAAASIRDAGKRHTQVPIPPPAFPMSPRREIPRTETYRRSPFRANRSHTKTSVPSTPPAAAVKSSHRAPSFPLRESLRQWSRQIESWWSASTASKQYTFALLNIGLIGSVLLFLAQGPLPPEGWRHTVQSATGFLGLLLLDVSAGLAGYLYLSQRLKPAHAQAPARLFWASYRRLSALLRDTP
jgi:general secretion pathway protein A